MRLAIVVTLAVLVEDGVNWLIGRYTALPFYGYLALLLCWTGFIYYCARTRLRALDFLGSMLLRSLRARRSTHR